MKVHHPAGYFLTNFIRTTKTTHDSTIYTSSVTLPYIFHFELVMKYPVTYISSHRPLIAFHS